MEKRRSGWSTGELRLTDASRTPSMRVSAKWLYQIGSEA